MRSTWRVPIVFVSAALVAALAGSCADPVHDQQVKNLPAEDPAVPVGEFHRAGQPCVVCHGPEGPAKTRFAVAGTVFWHHTVDTIGVDQAQVSIIDALGANPVLTTNCVGNFFIRPEDWPGGNGPAFPLKVSVFGPNGVRKDMQSHVNRDGSCANCHNDPPNYNYVGHVWLVDDSAKIPALPQDCPADPQVSLGGGP